MSKDIRSYFSLKSSTSNQKQKGNDLKTINKIGPRKRRNVVIDSDSDDEKSSATAKRSKPLKGKDLTKINKEDNVKSKYFKAEKVNVDDIFGSGPVKRDTSRNIFKTVVAKEVLEFHLDKDFESELAKLDLEQIQEETKPLPNSKSPEDSRKLKKEKSTDEIHKIDVNKKAHSPIKSVTQLSNKNNSDSYDTVSETSRKKVKLDELHKPPNEVDDMVEIPHKTKCHGNKINGSKNKDSSLKISPTTKAQESIVQDKSSKTSAPQAKPSPQEKKLLFPDLSSKPCSDKGYYSASGSSLSQGTLSEETCLTSHGSQSPLNEESLKTDAHVNIPCNLWVEKYKPSTIKQIIGQQGEKSCVNKLMVWLKNWHNNQSGNKKLTKPSPWAKNDDGAYYKAALLSGSPGVGKTTTAHLVSKELGFDVVEFNASDTRSKKLLHQEVSELLSTNSLSPFLTGKGDAVTKRHVLLMDEVDGMAGNEDRGGVQELIQLVKTARVPIICMCNDRNHPKIRSLANYCFDLRFSKPRAEQIRGAMMSLCFKENLKIPPKDLMDIISSANQDIRLIINHLSMLSVEKSSFANSSKHIKMGPWDITRKIFSEEEHKTMSIHDKCDLFFHDYNVTPLFVQDNYLNAVPHKPEAKNKIKKMELFAKASRSLSLGDLTEKSIRTHNAWGLLPVQAIFSSLVPGDVLEGHIGAQINFPAWFGKNSRQTKMSRLLQELTVHTRLKISGNKEAMNLDYLLPLERRILMPLVTEGTDGIPQALEVLAEYCLVREDIESFSELSAWPNSKNLFSAVESKVKAAFTRAYNKTSAPTPYAAVPIKKAAKSDVEGMEFAPEDEEGASPDIEDEEEDDSLEVDAMIVVKKKAGSKDLAAEKRGPSSSKGSKNAKRGRKK